MTMEGQKLGRLQEMLVNGKPVLGEFKVTPLNALKYKINDGYLFAPDGSNLGNIGEFYLNGTNVLSGIIAREKKEDDVVSADAIKVINQMNIEMVVTG